MARVYLSLGSNLGDRLNLLRAAVDHLRRAAGVEFVGASSLYETEPWEAVPGAPDSDSHWYLNCAVAIDTGLPPERVLELVQAIERDLGREPRTGTHEVERFRARPMDIDILLYEDRVISVPDSLQVPHLLLHERAFVLRPLAELAPAARHPVLYQTVQELLADLDDDHQVRRGPYPTDWFAG